jgi:Bacteriophage tail sheath protein
MPSNFVTPGVYVKEIKVFPPSVAEVESAVPAFVGYTQTAKKDADNDLILKPTPIFSMTQFEQYYGKAQVPEYDITITETGNGVKTSTLTAPASPVPGFTVLPDYLLYHAVRMYFENGGGGPAYIVSVGLYQDTPAFGRKGDGGTDPATAYGLQDGLDAVSLEDEPTLLVIPEAVKLTYGDYLLLTQAMLTQASKLGDRFAVLDAYDGYKDTLGSVDVGGGTKTVVAANRDAWQSDPDILKYGAAYYPFVKTAMNPPFDEATVNVTLPSTATATLATLKTTDTANYSEAKALLARVFLVLPASGAVTGVYAYTDTARGVWKAPANVSLNDVLEPVVKLDDEAQGPLNIDATGGKSINALRAFAGKGTLVWGARTLAGNDNEWRYVNVRRFFNMVEESVKKSTYWAVFESNDSNTWVKVRGMIESYLTQKWREGALAGATPKDAFFVRCGLGTTMDAQDILEGRMNVEIGMAVVRPAEFIILKFSHKMQVS